ncbi:hypothetical protein BC833DRAFT_638476 [Globomyces pollinis-pini]|nr:hypothetical protein BC833DRAFT_638476 [Globomyces pollinis-pini]
MIENGRELNLLHQEVNSIQWIDKTLAVFGANNIIPTLGCQKVLDPVRKERDSNCGTAFPKDGAGASLFNVVFDRYCTDACLQTRIKYINMFGNDACKDDVFKYGDINITAALFAKLPELKNSGFCRKVNNKYCVVTEMNYPADFDIFTNQNKAYLCTDCMKDYFSNPNELHRLDYISPEIAANSTKALNNYEKVCGPVNKKSSAHGMNIWTVHLAVLLMYLGL